MWFALYWCWVYNVHELVVKPCGMLISKPSTRWMVNFGCLCLTNTTMSTLIIQFKMGCIRFESIMSPSIWIDVMLWKVHIFAYPKFIQQHAYPFFLLMHPKGQVCYIWFSHLNSQNMRSKVWLKTCWPSIGTCDFFDYICGLFLMIHLSICSLDLWQRSCWCLWSFSCVWLKLRHEHFFCPQIKWFNTLLLLRTTRVIEHHVYISFLGPSSQKFGGMCVSLTSVILYFSYG